MENQRKALGVWLRKMLFRLLAGVMWLFEVVPLTAFLVLPVGLFMTLAGMKVDISPNRLLLLLGVTLLIDGFVGYPVAEEKAQKLQDLVYLELTEPEECNRKEGQP